MIRSTQILATALLIAGSVAAAGQARQQLNQVTITAPLGTAAQPFRTSFSQLAISFSQNGGSGVFVGQSLGADVNGTNFLINEATGAVGAFFNTPGLKVVSVQVTPNPTGTPVKSAPTFIVFDNQPPVIVLTQIQTDPRLPFVAFDPAQTYYTSADAIVLKGIANDGPLGTPPNQLVITGRAGNNPSATVNPDATGQFTISISLAGLPDGPGELSLTAADKMSDGSRPNIGKAPKVRLGQ